MNFSAELSSAMLQVINKGNVIKSNNGERYYKFAVFQTRNGKILKAGKDVQISKQNGEKALLEINIPADSLPSEVNTLIASIQTFQPVGDADKFPGDYIDDKGRRIVSLGFDYISIKDDSGRNIGEAVKQAIKSGKLSKAQATGTTITRWISSQSCEALMEDYCKGLSTDDELCKNLTPEEKQAFNVPIYTYNPYKGLWEMLGIASLDKNSDGVINDDDKFNSKDEAKNVCKRNGGIYALIRVSNEDFERYWWNLDYPLVFEQPKQLCIDVNVSDNEGNPLNGSYIYIMDDDNDSYSFNSAWATLGSDGKARLTVALLNNSDTDREATLWIWDNLNYQWIEEKVTLGESPSCSSYTKIVEKPELCTVEGYIKDKDTNQGMKDKYVYTYSVESYWWSYTYTDETGKYSINAKCNELHFIYTYSDWTSFKPDGELSGDEESDDGQKVKLKDFIYENKPPYVYGWIGNTSIKVGRVVSVYIYGWDYEGDSPLTWKIMSGNNTLKEGSWNSDWGYEYVDISFSSEGNYNLKLQVTDSRRKTAEYDLGTINVTSGNRKPVIYYAYPSSYFLKVGNLLYLYAYVYDPDGDDITCKWKKNGEVIGEFNYYGYGYCDYTVSDIQDSGNYKFKIEVYDGKSSSEAEFDVVVGKPAGIDIIIQSIKKRLFKSL